LFSRRSVPGMLHPWAHAGSRRFPGDPSQAFALLQDPGRAGKTSPLAVVPTPPPGKPNRRPQRVHNLEANTGLQLPLSTLRERRRRLPRKTRFRLAGCASTGRESNPLDRFERFQVTSILLSRTSPVARVVYAKRPFGGPGAVLAYLSRYTHRIAIANSRLVAFDGTRVTFKWKDYRAKGVARYQLMTLDADEFIRRFLIHVLPDGFHRIRHYGLFANANRAANIALARRLLRVPDPPPSSGDSDGTENRHEDSAWNACPCCGGRMIIIETFEPGSQPRQWPIPLIELDSS
jgi:Putative transposase